MKHILKFNDDKDEILNISESFSDGFSIPCTFYVHEHSNNRYDVYFNFKKKWGLDISEFNQRKKSFENRINSIGYEISYRTTLGINNSLKIFSQFEKIEGVKGINSILIILQKINS